MDICPDPRIESTGIAIELESAGIAIELLEPPCLSRHVRRVPHPNQLAARGHLPRAWQQRAHPRPGASCGRRRCAGPEPVRWAHGVGPGETVLSQARHAADSLRAVRGVRGHGGGEGPGRQGGEARGAHLDELSAPHDASFGIWRPKSADSCSPVSGWTQAHIALRRSRATGPPSSSLTSAPCRSALTRPVARKSSR